jgi:hypothetical protein
MPVQSMIFLSTSNNFLLLTLRSKNGSLQKFYELISTGLELEKATSPNICNPPTRDEVSDEEISEIVNQMTSHMKIVELACENS